MLVQIALDLIHELWWGIQTTETEGEGVVPEETLQLSPE